MKMLTKCVIGCMILALIAGCAATPITKEQADVQKSMQVAKVECYKQLSDHDVAIMKSLAGIPKDQVAFVVMLLEMQDNNKALMAIATGNNYDPCGNGANVFDVQIAEIREKNKAVIKGTSSAVTLGLGAITGYTLSNIFDSAGSQAINYTASENGKLNVGSQNTGSNNASDAEMNTNLGTVSHSDANDNSIDSKNAPEGLMEGPSEYVPVEDPYNE